LPLALLGLMVLFSKAAAAQIDMKQDCPRGYANIAMGHQQGITINKLAARYEQ
jgi:hypothetical protein